MVKRSYLSILFIVLFHIPDLAQNIENFSYRLQGDSIMVNYDLEGADRNVIVQLFSSHDDFGGPLEKVNGEVGEEIFPGTSKTITWKAKEELGSFKGSVRLKLTTRYAPYLELDDSSVLGKYKRGKTYSVNLETNTKQDIRWTLSKGSSEVASGSWQMNDGSYSFTVPSKAGTGKDHRLVLSTENLREVSKPISIRPKYPVVIKAVPFLLAGTVVAVLLMQPDESKDIPDPFLPDE